MSYLYSNRPTQHLDHLRRLHDALPPRFPALTGPCERRLPSVTDCWEDRAGSFDAARATGARLRVARSICVAALLEEWSPWSQRLLDD